MAQVIATENATTISITTEYETQEIWNALVGSGFANTNYWVSGVELDSWDNPCEIKLTHLNKHNDKEVVSTITPSQIYSAFAQLVKENTTHCGGYPIQDLETSDSCFANLVLQTALFDESIFG